MVDAGFTGTGGQGVPLVYILAAIVAAALGGPLVIIGLRRRQPAPTPKPAIATSATTTSRAHAGAHVPEPERRAAPVVSLPGPGPRSRQSGAASSSLAPAPPGVVTPLPSVASAAAFADPLLDALAARERSDAVRRAPSATAASPDAPSDGNGTAGPAWVRRLDARMQVMPRGLPDSPAHRAEGRADRSA